MTARNHAGSTALPLRQWTVELRRSIGVGRLGGRTREFSRIRPTLFGRSRAALRAGFGVAPGGLDTLSIPSSTATPNNPHIRLNAAV